MSTSLGLSPESAPGTGNLRASVLVITLTDDDGRLRIPHTDGAAIHGPRPVNRWDVGWRISPPGSVGQQRQVQGDNP
jgi:hypothetical protein